MIRSKAIKDTDDESVAKRRAELAKRPIYRWWRDSAIRDWYKSFTWFFIKRYRKVKKIYDWNKNVLQDEFDFDAHGLYRIIEYKLQRLYPVLEKGHAIQEDKDMKALRLAIKLAGRLKEDNYDMDEYDRMEKKWGKLKMDTSRVASRDAKGKPTSYHCDMSRPGVITDEDKENERADLMAGYKRGEAKKLREQKIYSQSLLNTSLFGGIDPI